MVELEQDRQNGDKLVVFSVIKEYKNRLKESSTRSSTLYGAEC